MEIVTLQIDGHQEKKKKRPKTYDDQKLDRNLTQRKKRSTRKG